MTRNRGSHSGTVASLSLRHQRRHPPHHLTDRPPPDPGDPPADQPRIGVHGVDHMEPVREQVEPQRQHRRRRLVDRERPHVPVPPPDTDPGHQPHHLDRDLVPAQRRQRPLQRRDPPPPGRLAHPVEQVRVERLDLRHQQSEVGQPPARGGVRAPWATGRRAAGRRGRPARRAGIRGVAPQRPTRPQQHAPGRPTTPAACHPYPGTLAAHHHPVDTPARQQSPPRGQKAVPCRLPIASSPALGMLGSWRR